jgi:hypothetical protein
VYRLFCENFKNYLKINSYTEDNIDERYKIAEPLFALTDINTYEMWKKNNYHKYEQVNNLVFGIYSKKDEYRRFEHFSWELGMYGYKPVKSNKISATTLNEQLNLVKLLLSFEYGDVDDSKTL